MVDHMKNNLSYDTVDICLNDYLKATTVNEVEQAFAVIADGAKYIDFTSYLLRNLQSAIRDANFDKIEVSAFCEKIVRVLVCILPEKFSKEFLSEAPSAKSEQAKRLRLPSLRHSLTDTWTKLLDKEIPDDLMLENLKRLGDGELRKMTDTRLLSSYVIVVFDPQPANQVPLSWSRAVSRTLISLIHSGGLNYDRLYPRLYRLLTPCLLTCPYAERFLIDLDVFLSSVNISAVCVAAFAKRLAQLSLEAPLWMLPGLLTLVANCLNRHQACRVLVDRQNQPNAKRRRVNEDGAGVEADDLVVMEDELDARTGDPFDYDGQVDFKDSGSLESSLWEIACLERHYCPEVASLANRIRQIAGSSAVPLPDLKAQLALGRQITDAGKRSAGQYLSGLRMTNARIPVLEPLAGWRHATVDSVEENVVLVQ